MTCAHCRTLDRRTFLGLLGTGLAVTLAGCGSTEARSASPHATTPTSASAAAASPTTTVPPTVVHGPIPAAHPGQPQVFFSGPPASVTARQVAITIDDGYCADCAQAYVAFAQSTGTHITFSPNGTYHDIWAPLAETLKPLIERGQVQIGNHTYTHPDLKKLSDADVTSELERNDQWIEQTFGITGRPWWRPPYGFHDERTDTLAGQTGYTHVLMWNGSYGDSALLTPQVLLAQAQKYLNAGVIMLGHANHPTVTTLFPQIQELISSRQLTPVTLDEMFGTSRDAG